MVNCSNELRHYGVLGMKWGMRRATYKLYGANGLRKSANRVSKDIDTAKLKANKQKKKAAKFEAKSAKYMAKGNFNKGSKFLRKASKSNLIAQKREKNIIHNEKLLKLYNKRLSELNDNEITIGKTKMVTLLGGPIVGIAAGLASSKKSNVKQNNTANKLDDIKRQNNKKKINEQKVYDKFYADDIEGVVKNMSKKQLDDLDKHVPRGSDWPEIKEYVMKKYRSK